ncbi:MAG TPA: hypothetical protein VFA75_10075 [Nevskia sp.]|nr:hypothetical protein [Nevskia sp.]
MVALPLIHKCGAQVDHAVISGGTPFGRLVVAFSDSQTDDPLSVCPRCGAPLYEAFVAGDFKPKQVRPTTPSARRTGAAESGRVREGAAKKIQEAIADLGLRRAAVGA